MIRANFNITGYLVPPLGYPCTLAENRDVELNGVIPAGKTKVTVKAYALKTATVHLALHDTPSAYAVPLVDGAVLSNTDDATDVVSYAQSETSIGIEETEISIEVPDWEVVHTPYLFRCWVSNVTGALEDTNTRKTGVATADQPFLPGYVTITEVTVS